MDFEAVPPDMATFLRGGSSWDIFATGEFDLKAGDTLERLLADKRIPDGSELHIRSAGGSLIGGMNLGRVIRAHGLIAHVGQKGPMEDGFQHTVEGHCMSAAALAFLGGESRYVSPNSRYGVHRFTLNDRSPRVADDAQVLAASVVEYIRSMEVDIELFSIASDCPSDDILDVPPETIKRLNVVNNGVKAAQWTIESVDDMLYLKGERDTIYGLQKFLLVFPSKGNMFFYIIFDGGQSEEAILMMEVDQLSIDSQIIPLSELRVSRFSDHGCINIMYQMTPEILTKLRTAKMIGYHLQHSTDAAMFVGFDALPFQDGASKLPGLIDVFFRERNPDDWTLPASGS
jgi:hypothetical protein